MNMTPTDVSAATLARIIIGGFFAISGANNLLTLSDSITVASNLGIPMAPLAVLLTALSKTILGVLIVIKFHTKLASLLLAIYIAITTLLFYNPLSWTVAGVREVIFVRNIAILGGLLLLYAHSRGIGSLQSGKPQAQQQT